MSKIPLSSSREIQRKPFQYRLSHDDLYRYIPYEALKLEGAGRMVERIWDSIHRDAIVFEAGHYDRYSGNTSPAIPYIDPRFRLKEPIELGEKSLVEFYSGRLLNKFAYEHKEKYLVMAFIKLLRTMIFRVCVKHFNTANQYALADAMSAELCPLTIHWYDDMVILEIKHGRDRT